VCHTEGGEGLSQDDLFGGMAVQPVKPINEGAVLRDEALARVEAHADAEWKRIAYLVLCRVAVLNPTITSDNVWDVMTDEYPNVSTHEPRAMGATMKAGQKAGLIEPTDTFVRTPRPQAHKAPIMVWKSLVHQ
jgi:hypothetical protein